MISNADVRKLWIVNGGAPGDFADVMDSMSDMVFVLRRANSMWKVQG